MSILGPTPPAQPWLRGRQYLNHIFGPDTRGCGLPQVVPPFRRPTVGQRCQCIDRSDAVANVSAQRLVCLRVPFAGERLQDADGKVELVVIIGRVRLGPGAVRAAGMKLRDQWGCVEAQVVQQPSQVRVAVVDLPVPPGVASGAGYTMCP